MNENEILTLEERIIEFGENSFAYSLKQAGIILDKEEMSLEDFSLQDFIEKHSLTQDQLEAIAELYL